MKKLLYIESSPRKERSSSIEVSKEFLAEYKRLHPEDEIITLDLWNMRLPEMSGDLLNAKYQIIRGRQLESKEAVCWKEIEELIAVFKSADKYVISLPMWNFSIPYKLKHYLDLIVQPSYTFAYSKEKGYEGLIKDKPLLLIPARAGAYEPKDPIDFQTSYLKAILGFIGFEKISILAVEPTADSEENKKIMLDTKKAFALTLAKTF